MHCRNQHKAREPNCSECHGDQSVVSLDEEGEVRCRREDDYFYSSLIGRPLFGKAHFSGF